jgi:hypothetical protein
MKAPQLLLCGALTLVIATTGRARIGETLEECINRYGPPESDLEAAPYHPQAAECAFIKDGFDIAVILYKGKVADIMFRKVDGGRINDSEVDALLEANGALGWEKQPAQEARTHWTASDGSRSATLGPNIKGERERVLSIQTDEWFRVMEDFEKSLEKRERSEAEKTLKDF